MVLLQATVLLAMKHLVWIIKAIVKNVLIIMEMVMGRKLVVFNVISNGYFIFKYLIKFNMSKKLIVFHVVIVIIEIILVLMNAFVKQDIIT